MCDMLGAIYIIELENNSESVWVKVFANKTSNFVASLYIPPDGNFETLELKLKMINAINKGKKNNPPPSIFWGTSTSVISFGQADSTNQAPVRG